MSHHLVVSGGTIVDTTGERPGDIALDADGTISAIGVDLKGDRVLDASGCLVLPGLIDLNCHLGDAESHAVETPATGSRAAALGGYTTVVALSSEEYCFDTDGSIRELARVADGLPCRILASGAVTVGLAGAELTPMAELASAGVRLVVDDGVGVQHPGVLRRAMEYAGDLDLVIAQHAETADLAVGGHVHEGALSSRIGIPGIPVGAELDAVARALLIAHMTGGRLHLQHLSSARAVDLVRRAKADGVAVTAEVAISHLVLDESAVGAFDTAAKFSPPLRSADDRSALIAGVADGTIDAIVSAHEPCAVDDKELPFDRAAPGAIALEYALALALTHLELSASTIAGAMSARPASILGLDSVAGSIEAGGRADLCVVDPEATWTVDPTTSASLSRNTPFAGTTLRGRVRHTIFGGIPTVMNGELHNGTF